MARHPLDIARQCGSSGRVHQAAGHGKSSSFCVALCSAWSAFMDAGQHRGTTSTTFVVSLPKMSIIFTAIL